MASNQWNLISVTSLKYGAVMADGTMQGTLTQLLGIKEGTLNLNIPERESNSVYIEEASIPFVSLNGNVTDPDWSAEFLGVTLQDGAPLWDATYTAAGAAAELLSMESDSAPVEKAIEIKGLNALGVAVTYAFPRCKILPSTAANITKTDAVGFMVKGKILTPLNASGVVQPWWLINIGVPAS